MRQPSDKSSRGNASSFYVAGELCRRGYAAVVTLGNTPNTDVLCSNVEGTKFVHIQVKTYVPGNASCSVGKKAERSYGTNFFWVLGGIPKAKSDRAFEYYIIPSSVIAARIKRAHKLWLKTPGKNGRRHRDNDFRCVMLPPKKGFDGWNVAPFLNRWDLLEKKLRA